MMVEPIVSTIIQLNQTAGLSLPDILHSIQVLAEVLRTLPGL